MAEGSDFDSLAMRGRRRERLSMKDIARELGISTTAVSRGLRDDPGIGEATRQLIKEATIRLGYVPNIAGAALSTGRTFTTLFVVPYDIEGFPHLFHMEVLEGLADELAGHGYTIDLLFQRNLHKRNQTVVQALQTVQADGAVVVVMHDCDLSGGLDRLPLPVVVVNNLSDAEVDCVVADDEAGATAATLHLLDAGHRVVSHIAGPSGVRPNARRQEGYESSLRIRGIEPDPELIEAGALTRVGGYKAMSALLRRRPDISAVFCCRDIMAVGAIEALREAGRRVPDDVSVVGFDDEVFAEFISPPLTTVRKPRRQMGETAGAILLRRMRGNDRSRPQSMTLKTQLINRSSVAPYRAGPAG